MPCRRVLFVAHAVAQFTNCALLNEPTFQRPSYAQWPLTDVSAGRFLPPGSASTPASSSLVLKTLTHPTAAAWEGVEPPPTDAIGLGGEQLLLTVGPRDEETVTWPRSTSGMPKGATVSREVHVCMAEADYGHMTHLAFEAVCVHIGNARAHLRCTELCACVRVHTRAHAHVGTHLRES